MKKIIVLSFAVSALFLSVSCQKEKDVQNGMEFTAYVDGSDSKTVLNGVISEWNKDEIRVLNGTNTDGCAQNFVTAATASASAKFTPVNPDAGFSGEHFIAIAPAGQSGDAWWSDSNDNRVADKLWLLPEQTAVAGTYDPRAHLALAYTENSTLEFKNAVSLLKFKALNSNISSITVTVGKDEALTGNFSFDPVSLKMYTADHSDYYLSSSATVSGTFEAGGYYYMAVFPGEYSSLALSVNGKNVKTKEGPVTLSRNRIYDLGEVEGEVSVCEYGITGGMNKWNVNEPLLLQDSDGDGIFECKNLDMTPQEGQSAGFKFVKAGTWDGSFGTWKEPFYFDKEMASGDWYEVYTNNIGDSTKNILVSDTSHLWDVYIYVASSGDWGKGYKYTLLPAGSPTPSK